MAEELPSSKDIEKVQTFKDPEGVQTFLRILAAAFSFSILIGTALFVFASPLLVPNEAEILRPIAWLVSILITIVSLSMVVYLYWEGQEFFQSKEGARQEGNAGSK
jgi:O-antigen/teichoic acid export membrane protein